MDREPLENKILEVIKMRGDEGIVQSELWSILNINGREGAKAVSKLVKAGLIRKVPIVVKGRRTYRLVFIGKQFNGVKLSIKLNPVASIPCFLCRDLERCGLGGYFNPLSCNKLTMFLHE